MDDNDSLRESELKLARKGQQLRSIAATTIIITTKLAFGITLNLASG
jgi:hypothetical protein